MLQRGAVCCSVMHCVAVCTAPLPKLQKHLFLEGILSCRQTSCSVLQRVAACCSVLQCVAVCCKTPSMYLVFCKGFCHVCEPHGAFRADFWNGMFKGARSCLETLNPLEGQRWVLGGAWSVRVAVCCVVLCCVAVSCSVLQCVAVLCSALQCVAVCCDEIKVRGIALRRSIHLNDSAGFGRH